MTEQPLSPHRAASILGALGVLATCLACASTTTTGDVPEALDEPVDVVEPSVEPEVATPSAEPTTPSAEPEAVELRDGMTRVPAWEQDTVYAWEARPDTEMGPDDPTTVLYAHPVGGEWTEVTTLSSRPTAIDVSDDGRLAVVLQSSEHLDGLWIDGKAVPSLGLPEFPAVRVTTTIEWQDSAPNGTSVVEFRGMDMMEQREDVTLVETADGWQIDPNKGECVALSIDGDTATYADGTSEGQAVDLNDDGVMEVLMIVADSCGTGACVTPIYGACGELTGGYRVLGEPGAYEGLQVQDTRTNGWLDIVALLRGGPESGGPIPVRWAYDGSEYKAVGD